MEFLLRNVRDANRKIVENEKMKKQTKVSELYTDLETMYIDELLKSNYFNFEKLNQEINGSESEYQEVKYQEIEYQEVEDNLIEIRHVIATFYRDLHKNRELLEIFQTLRNHFKNDNIALHMITLSETPPSQILAKKFNHLYQNYEISFESRSEQYNWGDNDDVYVNELILCRKIRC